MCIVRMTVKVKRMACVEAYCMGMEAIATMYVPYTCISVPSQIAVVAVMCKPHRCPHITFTGNICVLVSCTHYLDNT